MCSDQKQKAFDFKKFNCCQCEEMEKYIWCESVRLNKNIAPTKAERTKCHMDWIKKYAKEFREWAEKEQTFYKDE